MSSPLRRASPVKSTHSPLKFSTCVWEDTPLFKAWHFRKQREWVKVSPKAVRTIQNLSKLERAKRQHQKADQRQVRGRVQNKPGCGEVFVFPLHLSSGL